MRYILYLIIMVFLTGCGNPKFKIDDCVKDHLVDRTRKIIKVDTFKYVYRIYYKRSKEYGEHEFFMRIKHFDQTMTKIKCPKETKDE